MIAFLNVLIFVLETVEVIAILALIMIGIDLAISETRVHRSNTTPHKTEKARHRASEVAKRKLREQKERTAHEGFFEESYVRGFDVSGALFHRGVQVPTAKALEYYRKMDELADTQIFLNTEEL